MNLQERIAILVQLGQFLESDNESWQQARYEAFNKNQWFVPEFIEQATANIISCFLQKNKLEDFVQPYHFTDDKLRQVKVGLVMAGNIPMVGLHDMICIFLSGHRQVIKLSSKDMVLIPFMLQQLSTWNKEVNDYISVAENLSGCDAYIATGSNNTGRYFEYYFGKYPHIIRKNRTSVAVLQGEETGEALERLADDIQLYFGLGCRNVTKLYVPLNYNFEPLLDALRKYNHYADFHKYRNNYDYQLALLMMGSKFYMTNDSILLSENRSLFSAVSHVHYEFYEDIDRLTESLSNNKDIQCISGRGFSGFGEAQKPALSDFADGIDTLEFLRSLNAELCEPKEVKQVAF